ncbi:glycosyltransferase [Marinilabiliaceae bacterium JC017]|nr:glycosyltransferase [Marinilabiliaceae bacterium JC017]
MVKYSVIIPVYNRPEEIVELLESLTMQGLKDKMEVIVIEDGSTNNCKKAITPYDNQLNLKYYFQENKGPGLARNEGARHAKGKYLIFFDSDCIIPSNYLNRIEEYLNETPLDCYGGPDREHSFFTPIQKAISYAMTSPITTGGIRGGKRKMDRFYPRSYNLGIKKEAFDLLNGFSDMRFGEDMDFSMRAIKKGLNVGLIEYAFVYHKRRSHFYAFFKQVFNSGVARIHLSLLHKRTLKPVHTLPALFTIFYPLLLIGGLLFQPILLLLFLLFPFIVFIDAWKRMNSFQVAVLSIFASTIQLFGYGTGFIKAFWIRIIMRKGMFHNFMESFYD